MLSIMKKRIQRCRKDVYRLTKKVDDIIIKKKIAVTNMPLLDERYRNLPPFENVREIGGDEDRHYRRSSPVGRLTLPKKNTLAVPATSNLIAQDRERKIIHHANKSTKKKR
mmetsp:Transcript_16920/g.38069  ORF Transcript_16920/g.38069 Transcript_16920/m.38069 type:complete len:111 (+) Transcript_16920:397-729(+)